MSGARESRGKTRKACFFCGGVTGMRKSRKMAAFFERKTQKAGRRFVWPDAGRDADESYAQDSSEYRINDIRYYAK
jgi:hypothetical protein